MSSGETASPRLDLTVVKGFKVLEALASADGPLGISALSGTLGLGKSNVHRLVSTLIELGLINQEVDTKRYYANLKCWELGSFVVERNALRRAAREAMQELLLQTGESTYLSILSGTDIAYLEKLEGSNAAQAGSRAGIRVPALLPASGKLLIAMQPNFEALADDALNSLGPSERRLSRDQVLEELRTIRDQGFATSLGGWSRGINSLAYPVGPANQPPWAALGFAILPAHWDDKRLVRYHELLSEAVLKVSRVLSDEAPGYPPTK